MLDIYLATDKSLYHNFPLWSITFYDFIPALNTSTFGALKIRKINRMFPVLLTSCRIFGIHNFITVNKSKNILNIYK